MMRCEVPGVDCRYRYVIISDKKVVSLVSVQMTNNSLISSQSTRWGPAYINWVMKSWSPLSFIWSHWLPWIWCSQRRLLTLRINIPLSFCVKLVFCALLAMIVVVSRVQCPMVCVGGNDRTPLLCSDDRLTPPLPHHHRPLAEVKLCISLQLRLQAVMSGGRELQCLDRTGERCENYLLEATCSPPLLLSCSLHLSPAGC